MKKLYTLIATCLLLLFVTPLQSIDAGVGHSRSGSSSRSSSSSSSSRSRSSSNSGSSSYRSSYRSGGSSYSSSFSKQELYGIVVFLIGVYVVVLFLKSKSNQSSSEKSYSRATVYYPPNHRRVEHNTIATSRVKYGDPNFDADAFTSWVREVYIQLQAAWTKKDWNLVRSLESASLYSQHSAQLEDYIQSQTTNVLERVYVENVRIKDFYENPDGNDTLIVILSSTLRDYVIEDKTRKVIEGDPQQDLFTVYQMNFIRKHGSQTESNVQDEAVSDHCPNCGAPLKISAISQCDYCGAELTRSPNQWVLDTYEVVDEDELYN
ncbi:zinc-ribbon domain-containing transport protein [Streptococcus sp. SM5]|uniref:zinc-ribbon domain-containing transport protein n=1 Tax=Streptococcus sp. SM5 TaxID=2898232 RepID=UPI0022B77FC8|nr:zinc-ribbon domain-containing transport protein [Streptococcus sp. SM5]